MISIFEWLRRFGIKCPRSPEAPSGKLQGTEATDMRDMLGARKIHLELMVL